MKAEGKMSDLAVVIRGISKRFGSRVALDDVSLELPTGRICGLTGPNGAGKSVLLRVICGLVRPSAGSIHVFGRQVGRDVEFPPEVGALIDGPGFLPGYSAMKNLELLAMIRNRVTREHVAATIRLVGLDPADRRPVRAYSTGMRQRLGIAQAIVEEPALLLLDEPTSALDRKGVAEVHRLLKDLRAKGTTILLTSHNHDEIRDLCDASFVMENGRIVPSSDTSSRTGRGAATGAAGP